MARTALTDVNFQSSVFKKTMQAVWLQRLAILNGLMVEAPDQMVDPNSTGTLIEMPRWNMIDGTWQSITTSLSTTYNKVTDYLDKAVWVEREVAFQAEQIVKMIAGSDKDATIAVAEQLGNFMAKTLNGLGISVLTGAFASTLLSSHVYSVDSAVEINVKGLVKAKQKLGDHGNMLNAIMMHSKVEADALSEKILTYDKSVVDSYKTGQVGSLLNMTPFVDDLLVPSGAVYNNYLGAKGGIIYKFRKRQQSAYTNANIVNVGMVEMELVRESTTAGGVDGLIIRFSGLVHIPGVQWNGTVVSNPTDAQLATGANWTKVAPDDRMIPLVLYKCA